MDKNRLNLIVRRRTGWDKNRTKEALEIVLGSIKDMLQSSGNRLILHGFGTFLVKMNKPRKARNIRAGTTVVVPARRTVKFKASPEFLYK
ncbi:HU family DNA-binding protein [Elusimicrobiota bacterium]